MSKRSLWMLAVGALSFAACGEGGSQAAEGESGGLEITVHDMTEAAVQELRLDIQADGAVVGNRAVTQPTVTLTVADVARTDPPSGPTRWNYIHQNLPIGTYLVTARTFDAAGLISNIPSFQSDQVTVIVTANSTVASHIFLKQTVDDGTFVNPIITAVNFEKKPEFDKLVPIKVQGSQGDGVLNLTAAGDGRFGTAPATWNGIGTGDAATTIGGAGIDWMPLDLHPAPNTPGEQTVKVTLTDESGNETSLTMQVFVDYQRGNVDFTIRFNHAPTIEMLTKIEIDRDETVVEMRAGYSDQEYPAEQVSFVWDLADCRAKSFTVGTVPFGTWDGGNSRWTGTLLGGGVKHIDPLVLTLDPNAELIGGAPSCIVTVTVTDQGLFEPGSTTVRQAGSVSSRTQRFVVTAGWVGEVINPTP